MKTYEGNLVAKGLRFTLVAARFNDFIVSKLVEGAIDGLKRHGVTDEEIDIVWVPGAFEIPLIAKKVAKSTQTDAVICLGAVIRGATSHYDFVAGEAAKGVAHASMDTEKPIVFGVLTTENIEQAIERAGTKAGNKGFEAAMTAIEMANLLKQL